MSFPPNSNSSWAWRTFDDTISNQSINGSIDHFFNESDHGNHLNKYYFYETEQFTVLWILFALIVFGNSSVIIALSISKRRKSRMNFFIKQLAFADLSVGLISVPTDIIWRKTVEWNAGNVACKVIRFVQVVVTYSSTYVLVALSIDRYDAITHPMNFTGSWKRARLLVALAWIVSLLFSAPILVLYREETVQGHLQCWIDFSAQWKWQVYMTLVAATLFVGPALIISFCYTVIVITIWAKSKHLSTSSPSAAKPPSSTSSTRFGVMGSLIQQQHPNQHSNDRRSSLRPRAILRLQFQQQQQQLDEDHDCRRASSRGLIPKAKVKTVKMTFVIVFVFILCWSPYIVFDLLQVFGHIPMSQTSIAVASFIQSLAPLNSAANPLIYCLFSTSFSRTLRKWLRVVCPWCGPPILEPNETGVVRQRWSSRRRLTQLTQTQHHPNSVFLRNRKTCDALVVDTMAAAVVTVV